MKLLSKFIEELTDMKELYGDHPVVMDDESEATVDHQDAEDDLPEAFVIT